MAMDDSDDDEWEDEDDISPVVLGNKQKVPESIMGNSDEDKAADLQLSKLPGQHNKSGVSFLKRSANVNKIMNYLSNYWTHRTSNEKSHSQVAGTWLGLVPKHPTWAQVKAMSTQRRLQRVVHPSQAFLSLSSVGKMLEVTPGTPDVKSGPIRCQKGLWLQLMCCIPFRLLSQDFGMGRAEGQRTED